MTLVVTHIAQVESSDELLVLIPVMRLAVTDGHCGALRQKDMLSSDSTLLIVQSNHELWHYPILFPW